MTRTLISEEEQKDQNNHQVTNSNILNPEVTVADDFVYCGTVNSIFDSTIPSQRPSPRQLQQAHQQQLKESIRQEQQQHEQEKEKEVKQQEIPEVHSTRCDCGCVPPIPSLFEMAALRKKFFEEQKNNNNIIKY